MSHLENYLRELRETRASGEAVRETSFYPALSNLFNAVGAELNPRVRAVITLKNRGAGLPDGGLFTARQLRRLGGEDAVREGQTAFKGQAPERGVVEVKGAGDDVRAVAESEQVGRYLRHYGQVLVTNLREFLLVGRGAAGEPRMLEGYSLAESERQFWQLARHPGEAAAAHGARFEEYLKRALLAAAPLDAPESLAWFLASYARDAKERIGRAPEALQSLRSVREALEQALGLRFEGEAGEQFFRSTLVQTLFYGVFSAWVLWSKGEAGRRGGRFDWRVAQWILRVPAITTLFEQVVTPTNVKQLGFEEVLDWTAETLNRVEAERFFERFEREQAVQYFYEPFLEAFDPELRKQLGVWYTPTEIVRYMVERADRVLREELGVADGLADERVYVLDPCCGTGAYLVEVLRRIKRTLDERGGDALSADDLKRAATGRVYGFEILPAPFVVAHLQLGLLLQTEGSPLAGEERAGVYLTNALTGWEPPKEPKRQLPFAFHALEAERDAAEHIKRETPILVVIGNPPYNGFAGVSPEEEGGLVEAYKEGLIKEWGIKKFNLDDLYVRFFRLAERRIAEMTGRGVVCFISNFSYLSDPSFVVMRRRFLREFDKLWFDSLNGDSRETGKLTPEGKPDPSVFSTAYNREGIRVGTAVGLLVRTEARAGEPEVRTRELWGVTKREDLLDSLNAADFRARYTAAHPDATNRYSFRPSEVGAHYLAWPRLVELCGEEPISGLQEMRKGALMSVSRDELERRMRLYYDPEVDWESLSALNMGLTMNGGRFDARAARARLQSAETFTAEKIQRYALYPFDTRWCYHTNVRPLWNEPRPALAAQLWPGNKFLVTRMLAERPNEQHPITATSVLPDYHLLRPNAVAIPFYLRAASGSKAATERGGAQQTLLDEGHAPQVRANISERARAYLRGLGFGDEEIEKEAGALVWYHALAIGYSPAYLEENADGIRADFPRVPLPAARGALEESAGLGREVAALLDTEAAVEGVTAGSIRPELREVGRLRRAEGEGQLDPSAGDLELRAGWGHRGRAGVVMPGKGRLRAREYTPRELAANPSAPAVWGAQTYDIFLNDVAVWSNVPARVWDYHVGGYQVIKKWLSYREGELTGRALRPDEAREVTQTARRLAALLLLEARLDENYRRAQADAHA